MSSYIHFLRGILICSPQSRFVLWWKLLPICKVQYFAPLFFTASIVGSSYNWHMDGTFRYPLEQRGGESLLPKAACSFFHPFLLSQWEGLTNSSCQKSEQRDFLPPPISAFLCFPPTSLTWHLSRGMQVSHSYIRSWNIISHQHNSLFSTGLHHFIILLGASAPILNCPHKLYINLPWLTLEGIFILKSPDRQRSNQL